ncbi:hypothetical protein SAY86_003500 [Trapa natans]|uniref:Uncharacterized protein n=1 Tax=Trapa natans TaxID=22666 RepID=A0AAN7M697_TRANT|nr:hypothetical protein SAY86_003500 [Trapa natans]
MVPSLCLQDFLVRARVLKLYRRSLRIARRAPDHARGLLVLRRKHYISPVKVSSPRSGRTRRSRRTKTAETCRAEMLLISDGLERVKNLDEMLDIQGR